MKRETFVPIAHVQQADGEHLGQEKFDRMRQHVERALTQLEVNAIDAAAEAEWRETLPGGVLPAVEDGQAPGDDAPEVGTMAAWTRAQDGDAAAAGVWQKAASHGGEQRLERRLERRVRHVVNKHGLTLADTRPHFERRESGRDEWTCMYCGQVVVQPEKDGNRLLRMVCGRASCQKKHRTRLRGRRSGVLARIRKVFGR